MSGYRETQRHASISSACGGRFALQHARETDSGLASGRQNAVFGKTRMNTESCKGIIERSFVTIQVPFAIIQAPHSDMIRQISPHVAIGETEGSWKIRPKARFQPKTVTAGTIC